MRQHQQSCPGKYRSCGKAGGVFRHLLRLRAPAGIPKGDDTDDHYAVGKKFKGYEKHRKAGRGAV